MLSRNALLLATLVASAHASEWKCYTDLGCTAPMDGTESSYYDCFKRPGNMGAKLSGGRCFMNKYDCWRDCECSRYDYCSGEIHGTQACADDPGHYGNKWYNTSIPVGNLGGMFINNEWKTGYEACFLKKKARSASIWGYSFYQAYKYAGSFIENPTYTGPSGEKIPYICDVDPMADPVCEVHTIVDGDPHFKTLQGDWFDFHGECDLVFLEAPSLNATIHVRTKNMFEQYSYVEAASLQINGDILEVSDYGNIILNGVYITADDKELPATVGGYPFELVKSNKMAHTYRVVFGENKYIQLKSFKTLVGVSVAMPKNDLADAVGLLGSVKMGGEFLGRDNKKVFDNANDFGLDWVVQPGSDPSLFQGEPNHPGTCRMPDTGKALKQNRRLGGAMARSEAEEACAKWTMNKEACIQDVLATGDKDMAANHY